MRRLRLLHEVRVGHCLLRSESLRGVHKQQLLKQQEWLAVVLDFVLLHVFHERAICVTGVRGFDKSTPLQLMRKKNSLCAFEVSLQRLVLWHSADVLPVFLMRETHHIKDAVELIVMIRIARLNVFLAAMKYWL